MKKIALTAHVNIRRASKPGKVSVVTDVVIRLDGRALAFATLGGVFDSDLALREFRKAHKRFQPQPGFNADMLALAAKAA